MTRVHVEAGAIASESLIRTVVGETRFDGRFLSDGPAYLKRAHQMGLDLRGACGV